MYTVQSENVIHGEKSCYYLTYTSYMYLADSVGSRRWLFLSNRFTEMLHISS